ncbi:MAG: mechanosensitive ion channel [Chlamydiales bacterium]|nr:mechanosensitive ion channel [Chlamydiales bacterium]
MEKALSYQKHLHPSSSYAIGRLTYGLILFVGIYIALSLIGINLTGIAVVAGALSVGLGFGLQTIISNFISGMIILTEKTIAPGDLVQIESGEVGIVLRVNIRSTLIETADCRKMVVPNTEIVTKKLTNWSKGKEGVFPLSVPLKVSREVDRKIFKETILGAIDKDLGKNKEHPSKIRLLKLTDKQQEWELTVWVEKKDKGVAAFFENLEGALTKEGIVLESIDYPKTFAFLEEHR